MPSPWDFFIINSSTDELLDLFELLISLESSNVDLINDDSDILFDCSVWYDSELSLSLLIGLF